MLYFLSLYSVFKTTESTTKIVPTANRAAYMPHCQYPGIAPPPFSCRIFATGAILSDSRRGHFGRPRPARPGYRIAARYVPTLLTTLGAHRVTPHSMRGPVKCRLRVPAFAGISGFRVTARYVPTLLTTPDAHHVTPHSMRGPVKCRLRVPAFAGISGYRVAARNDMNGYPWIPRRGAV